MHARFDKNVFASQETKAEVIEAMKRMVQWQGDKATDFMKGSEITIHENHFESKCLFFSAEKAMEMVQLMADYPHKADYELFRDEAKGFKSEVVKAYFEAENEVAIAEYKAKKPHAEFVIAPINEADWPSTFEVKN